MKNNFYEYKKIKFYIISYEQIHFVFKHNILFNNINMKTHIFDNVIVKK